MKQRSDGVLNDGPMVAGQFAADRVMRSLDYRLAPDARRLTRQEVAVVLHALADHTMLEAAREWRRDDDGAPWPTSRSVGRFLHDTADQLEQEVSRG
jgi:hypothetical protein